MFKSIFNIKAFKRPSPKELIAAAGRGDLDTAIKLRGWGIRGVDLNGTNEKGETALMRAAANGHEQFVDWLIDSLVNIRSKNNDGMTAEDIAKNNNHMKIAENLENAFERQMLIMQSKSINFNDLSRAWDYTR